MTCTRWRSPCPGIHKNDNGPPPPSRMIPKVDLNWPTWSPTVHIPNNLPDSFAAPHHNVTITWRISGSVTIFTKESWHWRTEMQENLAISSHLLIHPANWSFFKCNFKRSIGLLARQHFVHRTKPGTGPSHANPTWCELLSHTWKRITSFSHTFWACTWLFGEGKKYKKAMNSHHRRKNTKFQKFKIIDRLFEIEREPFQVSEEMTFSQHFYLSKNNDENLHQCSPPSSDTFDDSESSGRSILVDQEWKIHEPLDFEIQKKDPKWTSWMVMDHLILPSASHSLGERWLHRLSLSEQFHVAKAACSPITCTFSPPPGYLQKKTSPKKTT